jgi:Glycosyltransferase 61
LAPHDDDDDDDARRHGGQPFRKKRRRRVSATAGTARGHLLVVLTSPLRTYDPNIYHMLVMRNNQPAFAGRGRDLWCYLDAATRFMDEVDQQQEQQQQPPAGGGHHNRHHNIRWRLEYQNQTGFSDYAQQLFALLGSSSDDDHYNDDDHDTTDTDGPDYNDEDDDDDDGDGENNASEEADATIVRLSLRYHALPLLHGLFQQLARRVPGWQTGPIGHSFHFRPQTVPNEALIQVAERIVRRVVVTEPSSSSSSSPPLVLLILRAGPTRQLAGSTTGTAAEIVHALLDQAFTVRVMDLAAASVADQMAWFHTADLVIGLHGAGLTNLVWMDHDRNRAARGGGGVTLIEIAASYGWGKYLDVNGSCQRMAGMAPLYMKADFYNLARRFRVRHMLVHPVYSAIGRPGNPIDKAVFYVDATALAATARRALNDAASSPP